MHSIDLYKYFTLSFCINFQYTLLLSALFIFTSYSANIVALLQSTTKSIRNVEDLLKFKIELGVEDISYSRFYFPRQTDPIKKQIYEKKIANKNDKFERFYNISYGIRRMQTVNILF